jgi:hypothetical protein
MDIIRTHIVYYDSTGEQHTYKTDALVLKERFANHAEVDWNGVNGVVAEKDGDTLTIIQAGGWNSLRGMFVDMYPR